MRGLWRGFMACAMALCLLAAEGAPVAAQQVGQLRSSVLVVESERLFRDSAFGKRIAAQVERDTQALAAENRRIEAELGVEEQDLTERRPDLSPDEFRDLADAFDAKVRELRGAQEAKARAIAQGQETARAEFLSAAAPVLELIMRDYGATVVLERRSVFLSLNAIDITQDALTRIDATFGDGSAPGAENSEEPDDSQ